MQSTFHRSAACLFTLLYVIIVCAGCPAAVVGGGRGGCVWGVGVPHLYSLYALNT